MLETSESRTRREVLSLGASFAAGLVLPALSVPPQVLEAQAPALAESSGRRPEANLIRAGQDAGHPTFHHNGNGLFFKATKAQTGGSVLCWENHGMGGGPDEHLHLEQEEYLYVVEGRVTVKVNGVLSVLSQGDSALVPRNTPHAFALSDKVPSRLLVVMAPALNFEQYFVDAFAAASPLPDNSAEKYGKKHIGPPIKPLA
jgi:quercetin 2,3-dioxygenase